MDRLHTHYRLTIETLSPLHIGTGNELVLNVDYVRHQNQTWVVDQGALMEIYLDEYGRVDNRLLGRPLKELLRDEDYYPDNPFFRYILPGETSNRPLSEQIKDVWGYPYIPGSSVKGMLRTLLLWGIHTAEDKVPDLSNLNTKAKIAARPLEQAILAPAARGRDFPNKDILKALRVSDSTPLQENKLHVATVRVFPTGRQTRGKGVQVDVEAIDQGAVFEIDLTIDEYGFTNPAAISKLGWEGLRKVFDHITNIGQFYAKKRCEEEYYFHNNQGPQQAKEFYEWIYRQSLADNEWMAQIGWGTGWRSQTLDNLLTDDSEQNNFESDVLGKYRRRMVRGNRREGDPFPKTRKLMLRKGQPAIPMGWVKCRLEKK